MLFGLLLLSSINKVPNIYFPVIHLLQYLIVLK